MTGLTGPRTHMLVKRALLLLNGAHTHHPGPGDAGPSGTGDGQCALHQVHTVRRGLVTMGPTCQEGPAGAALDFLLDLRRRKHLSSVLGSVSASPWGQKILEIHFREPHLTHMNIH